MVNICWTYYGIFEIFGPIEKVGPITQVRSVATISPIANIGPAVKVVMKKIDGAAETSTARSAAQHRG